MVSKLSGISYQLSASGSASRRGIAQGWCGVSGVIAVEGWQRAVRELRAGG
jgi:hypothetical protein